MCNILILIKCLCTNCTAVDCTAVELFQQQQTKSRCTSCMFKSNQLFQKRRNKIHLNSRKRSLPLHNDWNSSMLESGPIFECCNIVSDINIQCTAMLGDKRTFQVQENDGNACKKLEHLCALRGRINTCQHFLIMMDRWLKGKKRLQRFQPDFL